MIGYSEYLSPQWEFDEKGSGGKGPLEISQHWPSSSFDSSFSNGRRMSETRARSSYRGASGSEQRSPGGTRHSVLESYHRASPYRRQRRTQGSSESQ